MIRLIATASFILTAATAADSASDSAEYLLRKGVDEYDSLLLKQAVVLSRQSRPPGKYLFTATCLWRIQIIKYVADDKKGTVLYGTQALATLDSAERNNEDRYFVEARRAYVNQLMAGVGITARYSAPALRKILG